MANALLSAQTTFLGSTQRLGKDNGSTITMRAGGTKQLKKVQKAVQKPAKQAANVIKGTGAKGFRRYNREALWLPNTERPEWLDGTLPGDRGFDPLGLARPTEYLQMGVDSLDQNKAVNKAGDLMGKFNSAADKVTDNSLSPYNEVFGLERFRECELIHGRWAMLATLGAVVAEASTGVSWVDAGKVELDGAQYLGLSLPFTIGQLCWIEAILVGGAEIYRNTSLDIETRLYPGGAFDPLGLASGDEDRAFKLKTAEIKHARLAMVAFLGYGVQALATGEGALGSLAKFADTFGVTALDKFE